MFEIRRTAVRRAALVAILIAAAAVAAQDTVDASPRRTPEGPSGSSQPVTAPPTSQVDPYADYLAPSGPTLSPRKISKLALREGARDGDANPTSVAAATGSLLSALNVMSADSAVPTPSAAMSRGERAAMEASVYVVQLRGSFALADARVRPGEPAPQGTVLRLILDAHTGELEGRSLGEEAPVPLANLGRVEELG